MSYRACFDCELIFEVDDVAGAAVAPCPQCGGALEAYEPEAEELGPPTDDETPDPAIAATMTVDGLSEAVAQKVADHLGQAPATEIEGDGDDARAPDESEFDANEPTRARAIPQNLSGSDPKPLPEITHRARPRFGQSPAGQARPGGGKTRVLEAVDALASTGDHEALGIGPPAPAQPARGVPEMAPTAMLEGLPPMPPKGSGHSGEHPTVAPPISAPDERHFPTLTPNSRPGRRAWPMWLAIVFLLGGGGAATWYFLLRTPTDPAKAPNTQPATEAPAELSWTARIERQLDDGEARLPVISGLPAVEEGGVYLAGGAEGLMTSAGPVTGMPTSRVRKDILDSDMNGQWVRPLVQTLQRASTDPKARFSLALDAAVPAGDALRMAFAAYKHGHRDFALLAARADGGLGALPFQLTLDKDPPPPFYLLVRIGRSRGFNITVRKGTEVVSAEPRLIDRKAGKLDLRALDDRLAQLAQAHPGVPTVIVHPLPDMPLSTLVAVLARINGREATPKFGALRLGVR